MHIAVLGTGMVGRTLATRLAGLGHDVVIGTRHPDETLARTEPDPMGTPPYRDYASRQADVRLATFADAVLDADLVINATSGRGVLDMLESIGEEALEGRVLMDLSNPLDFSAGFPPTLFIKDTDSLGEQVQAAFPRTRVVKSLNTLTADLMVYPQQLAEGGHSVFVSGNDPDAKALVTGLLSEMGHTDVIDLGDITTSRGVEMWMPLWLRLMGSLGTANFNLRIVR